MGYILQTLEKWGYVNQLAEDIEKNFKYGDEAGDSVTIYAMFSANGTDPETAKVKLDLEVYDLEISDENPLVISPIQPDNSKLFMYEVYSGDKNIFNIEFREAGKGAGHPPQVKAGSDKLDAFLVKIDDL